MRLLLDTHAFIWWASEPERLSEKALSACVDNSNVLILSVASVWEMQIKSQLGKLTLSLPLSDLIENQQQANRLEVLPIELSHVLALANLPAHH